jgi:hypothetical protein
MYNRLIGHNLINFHYPPIPVTEASLLRIHLKNMKAAFFVILSDSEAPARLCHSGGRPPGHPSGYLIFKLEMPVRSASGRASLRSA